MPLNSGFLISLFVRCLFLFLGKILQKNIVAQIASGSHQGPQTEFDFGRSHQIANLLLILEHFFRASCSQEKLPPNITREVIFKQRKTIVKLMKRGSNTCLIGDKFSKAFFCCLKVLSLSQKRNAINQGKVLTILKVSGFQLTDRSILRSKKQSCLSRYTVKPPNSGHLMVCEKLSAIRRGPLLGRFVERFKL